MAVRGQRSTTLVRTIFWEKKHTVVDLTLWNMMCRWAYIFHRAKGRHLSMHTCCILKFKMDIKGQMSITLINVYDRSKSMFVLKEWCKCQMTIPVPLSSNKPSLCTWSIVNRKMAAEGQMSRTLPIIFTSCKNEMFDFK